MSRQLYLNFIKDNRWKYIVNGLGTTLQITCLLYTSDAADEL